MKRIDLTRAAALGFQFGKPDNFASELACAVIGILLVFGTIFWLLTLE